MSEKIKIRLTGRPPVRIDSDAWPVIAKATYSDHDGKIACQANRSWRGHITVRQSAVDLPGEARAIVYGEFSYSTNWQDERDSSSYAGELVSGGDDIPEAILRVQSKIDVDGRTALAEECIGDLPAQDL